MEHRSLTLPDYLVWGGFICALGWFACSTRALYILIDHPLDEETRSDSVEYLKLNSTWNTYSNLVVNWTLNFGTDLLLFGLPFFIFNCLKLRRRQKVGLVGIFSLGAITMAISLARFIVYNMDYDIADADGTIIVVSLPSLKALIIKPTPATSSNRSNSGYLQAGSGKTIGSKGINFNGHSSNIQGGTMDDEMELTFLDRKASPTPTGTTDGSRLQDGKDNVMVTTDFEVTSTRNVF
ncbi:hypothetical protein J4E90_009891 [Alternaria incomplexa]|uniref:uncharacterized protein n=1 Tax=Alternaria incomplexa TaxID=1187928 RepID=UPI00221F1285|nr:uncharacterized protein J4E90_009891 [Alternaria incomplexa]KAI4906997.1 hypothetical protein J4E90_009891 [Alternaria incomplexa]